MRIFLLLLVGYASTLLPTSMPLYTIESWQIDFDAAMGNGSIQFGLISPDDKEWFIFFRELYQKYHALLFTPDSIARIPKIIHQIWLGSPIPKEYKAWMDSWPLYHPEWIYCVWTDSTIKEITLRNQLLFDQARNYGQKSDILRYELLYQFGGLYLDVDFRCLKPFDIFHHCYDFYIGILNGGAAEVAIGLIGSVPHHPILDHVIQSMHDISSINPETILDTTGNFHFLRCFMDIAPTSSSRIITFPCNFFYPSPNWDRFLTPEEQDKWIAPESFAIHYWSCSWQKPEAEVKNRKKNK